jgi:hypothetical protein
MKKSTICLILLGCTAFALISGCTDADREIIKASQEPELGENCNKMENYFNKYSGRTDTNFSNYQGQVQAGLGQEIYCGDGGVKIQTLPTGKKTCTAYLYFNTETKTIRWYVANEATDCFVSQ